jgi:putative ABC transport system permease protein
MRSFCHALFLSMSDYWHERLLSACSILGLAAVLTPLLVLFGVHHGIITAMTERLLNDPRTLEITPVGSGRYGPDWFGQIETLPGVAFVIPQTRSIAATIHLGAVPSGQSDPAAPAGKNSVTDQSITPLTATADGDPVLLRWKQPPAGWESPAPAVLADPDGDGRKKGGVPEKNIARVILSASTARKLGAVPGSLLPGRVDRVRAGKREAASLFLRVLSVLPAEAQDTDMAYVPLELLVATEEYRDGKAVPFLDWTGDPPSFAQAARPVPDPAPDPVPDPAKVADARAGQPAAAPSPSSVPDPAEDAAAAPKSVPAGTVQAYADELRSRRTFASFRLYAKTLDDVALLERWLQTRKVEVYVKSAEIDTVRNLDGAFRVVFGLIAGTALFGFAASTASSALAGVRRKNRSLGVMRLLGFQRAGILLFPLAQSVATGFFGSALASFLYLGVAVSIDSLFSSSLPGGEAVCSLPASSLAAIFGLVLLLSALSSLSAAWQAAAIEPSEVIRDV